MGGLRHEKMKNHGKHVVILDPDLQAAGLGEKTLYLLQRNCISPLSSCPVSLRRREARINKSVLLTIPYLTVSQNYRVPICVINGRSKVIRSTPK